MDDKLTEALNFSNYMIALDTRKRLIKEQYENNLLHFFDGAQFTVTPGLISFCQALLELNQKETVLVDDNSIPVAIPDIATFLTSIVSTYFKATNTYYKEYNNLKKDRNVEGIIK